MLSFSDAELKSEDLMVKSLLDEILHSARTHLGMEVAFISEFKDGARIFRLVDCDENMVGLLKVDDSGPLEESYCQRVVDGRMPNLMQNSLENEEARKLPVTFDLPVGAHISVPLYLKDGSVYGTFCGFSRQPYYELSNKDLAYFRAFSELAASMIQLFVVQDRKQLEAKRNIQRILDSQHFNIVYQPIFNILTGKIVGFESLTRFKSDITLNTEQWFKTATQAGMSNELEYAAVEKALHILPKLQKGQYLAVNVSPETILNYKPFIELLSRSLEQLVLEITEHERIDDYSKVAAVLAPLREKGLRLAVDDAGSGFASFRHILQLKPDIIKLDRSLIRELHTNPAELALTAAIVTFGKATASTIVAEGVETESELKALTDLGVCRAQGYLLGRPGSFPERK